MLRIHDLQEVGGYKRWKVNPSERSVNPQYESENFFPSRCSQKKKFVNHLAPQVIKRSEYSLPRWRTGGAPRKRNCAFIPLSQNILGKNNQWNPSDSISHLQGSFICLLTLFVTRHWLCKGREHMDLTRSQLSLNLCDL